MHHEQSSHGSIHHHLDQFGAGALIDLLQPRAAKDGLSDSAQLVWHAFRHIFEDSALIAASLNARRLLAQPALAPDVAICLQRDSIALNASLLKDGSVRPLRGFGAKLA